MILPQRNLTSFNPHFWYLAVSAASYNPTSPEAQSWRKSSWTWRAFSLSWLSWLSRCMYKTSLWTTCALDKNSETKLTASVLKNDQNTKGKWGVRGGGRSLNGTYCFVLSHQKQRVFCLFVFSFGFCSIRFGSPLSSKSALWTLSCDFAHTINETSKWLTQLLTLLQNHSGGDSVTSRC